MAESRKHPDATRRSASGMAPPARELLPEAGEGKPVQVNFFVHFLKNQRVTKRLEELRGDENGREAVRWGAGCTISIRSEERPPHRRICVPHRSPRSGMAAPTNSILSGLQILSPQHDPRASFRARTDHVRSSLARCSDHKAVILKQRVKHLEISLFVLA
jgi:hypothetical protein